MIFVTIGSMFPFERLIRHMDQWALDHPGEEVFAQIGAGAYEPRHMAWERMLNPREFEGRVRAASLIVAHAGMGSFITAMENAKPIVLMPRRAADREHTTDHQLDTAHWLKDKPGVHVATTFEELVAAIGAALSEGRENPRQVSRHAPEEFTARIRRFLIG
jgi:UDP-N-acetylglucosamine transferase subunit ALG13